MMIVIWFGKPKKSTKIKADIQNTATFYIMEQYARSVKEEGAVYYYLTKNQARSLSLITSNEASHATDPQFRQLLLKFAGFLKKTSEGCYWKK